MDDFSIYKEVRTDETKLAAEYGNNLWRWQTL